MKDDVEGETPIVERIVDGETPVVAEVVEGGKPLFESWWLRGKPLWRLGMKPQRISGVRPLNSWKRG